MSYLVCWVFEFDVQLMHSVLNSLERLDDITEDDRLPLQLLVLTEALCVDKLHLLEDSRFARLSSTWCHSVSATVVAHRDHIPTG